MSSQDDDSSIVSSSHDRSDDEWNGEDDDLTMTKRKKKSTAVATSGRRQLARRPSKPRATIGFGSYKYSSDSSSSSDDEGGVNNAANQSMKSEEDELGDDESASSDSPPRKIQRKHNKQSSKQIKSNQSTAKSNKLTATKSRKKADSESEEAEWDDDEEKSESNESESSDSDFGAPPPPSRKRRGNASAKTNTSKSKSSRAVAKTRTPRSTRATRKTYKDESESSSEDEIQYDTTPSGTRRPRRSCSQQTKQRMSNVVKQDMKSEREALGGVLEDDDKELLENSSSGDEGTNNNDDDDDDADDRRLQKQLRQNNVKKRAVRRKRKLGDESTDEDYDENNSDSDQDDEFIENDDDDEDYEIGSDDMAVSKRRSTRKQTQGSKKKPNYTEIDEDDIGTADESSDDEETAPSILTSPAKKSPGTYGTPASRKKARMGMNGRMPLEMREDGSSNEEQVEGEDSDEYIPPSRKRKSTPKAGKRRHYMDSSDSDNSNVHIGSSPITKLRTTCIKCSSVIDDITMMNLPKNKPHVCYIAPDGKSRHCFTLDTLYRIAISAKSDNDSISSSPLNFLQPPHFRSPMEAGLIDQIASRFGRPALVIENSSVYKKIKGGRLGSSNLDELDEFDEDGNYVGDDGEGDGTNFQDRFQRFITTLMGSSDIYCCPLCYIEADRRLGHQNDDEMIEDDDSEDEQGNDSHEDRFAFVDDPLTILGNLDDDNFEVASTFCFRLLSGLKKHLKVVHGVNLSDIEGNDLFKRFQVRASDGLLQRWLQKNLRRNTVQGDMMRYWNSGENQSFLLLLSQIDSTEPEYSSDFSLSFPNRARKIWNQVASPYMKHGQDIDDFIADDDESEESGNHVPINPHFTPPSALRNEPDFKSPEEEIIENLQIKNRYKSSTSNDSEDKSSSSDDEELEILEPAPSEESEEDEWTKSKSFQTRVKRKSKPTTQESDSENEFDADVEIIDEKLKVKSPPTSARKRIMESSSDEESY